MADKIKVVIYSEYFHERRGGRPAELYPNGMHSTIKDYLDKNPELDVSTVIIDMPDCGLTEELLKETDVLLWWGHMRHQDVSDEVVERVKRRILNGMGFIPLHSAHYSKIFRSLMGTRCTLHWSDDHKEIIWTVIPSHPIAKDIPEYFILGDEEMYGEPFEIPNPDEVVFMSWFNHGNVFRSGVTFRRGNGKIFYFQPGHESNPSYHNQYVLKIIENAIYWAKPDVTPAPRKDHFPIGTIKVGEL